MGAQQKLALAASTTGVLHPPTPFEDEVSIMANSTKAKVDRQPKFPLWKHKGTGLWCKKVRGRCHYFGSIAQDPNGDAGLALWTAQRDDLLAGRKPRPAKDDAVTVAAVCNACLMHQRDRLRTGEIKPRTWDDNKRTTDLIVEHLGGKHRVDDLDPDDFREFRKALGESLGLVALGNTIHRVRSAFLYAFEDGKIEKPVTFGKGFDKPTKSSIEKVKQEKGPKLIEAADLRKLTDAAGVHIKAMILLAANAGLGNNDVARLRTSHIDFAGR